MNPPTTTNDAVEAIRDILFEAEVQPRDEKALSGSLLTIYATVTRADWPILDKQVGHNYPNWHHRVRTVFANRRYYIRKGSTDAAPLDTSLLDEALFDIYEKTTTAGRVVLDTLIKNEYPGWPGFDRIEKHSLLKTSLNEYLLVTKRTSFFATVVFLPMRMVSIAPSRVVAPSPFRREARRETTGRPYIQLSPYTRAYVWDYDPSVIDPAVLKGYGYRSRQAN